MYPIFAVKFFKLPATLNPKHSLASSEEPVKLRLRRPTHFIVLKRISSPLGVGPVGMTWQLEVKIAKFYFNNFLFYGAFFLKSFL